MPIHLCNFVFLPVVICPVLSNPLNGMVGFFPDVTFQSTAQFTCHEGYQLAGPSSVTCGEDGQWSDSSPQCECEHMTSTDIQ